MAGIKDAMMRAKKSKGPKGKKGIGKHMCNCDKHSGGCSAGCACGCM